jgi:hypothetical protein
MTEDTQFEQQLVAYKPRLLREITVENLFAPQLSPHSWLCGYLDFFNQKIRPQMTACVCCFLLGAATMFVLMTCCFNRVPSGHRQLAEGRRFSSKIAESQSVSEKLTYLIDLDNVRSPADLMTQIRRQPAMVVKPEKVRSRELGVRSYFYSDLNL